MRLLSRGSTTLRGPLVFDFTSDVNLRSLRAPHMRRVVIAIADRDHFFERWTQTQNGQDKVFDLHFVRR